jgi:hypothetical protein
MNKKELSIRDAIKLLAGKGKLSALAAKVVFTDVNKGTANVSFEGSNDFEMDVRLSAFEMTDYKKAFIVEPEAGSYVLISRIEDSDEFFISGWTEVKSMYLGGDKYSVVKGETLKTEAMKVQAIIETFLNVLQTPIPEAGGGANSAFQAALKIALESLDNGDFSNILNGKVKHGN